MTNKSEWKLWTPQHDGHAPEDWVEGLETEYYGCEGWYSPIHVHWAKQTKYRYRPLQNATYKPSSPSLLDQCLALPQDQREALIEAMQKPVDWVDEFIQVYIAPNDATHVAEFLRSKCNPKDDVKKPQRDWADDVAEQLWHISSGLFNVATKDMSAVIRSMCRPKEELQHVAYYDEGQFHWMSGIAPRDCELFAKRKDCA